MPPIRDQGEFTKWPAMRLLAYKGEAGVPRNPGMSKGMWGHAFRRVVMVIPAFVSADQSSSP